MKYKDIQRIVSNLSFAGELHDHPAMIAAEKTGSDLVMNTVATALITAETAIKNAANNLSMLAEKGGEKITVEDLEAMAILAEEFDKSGDPLLEKQASVLDFILTNFSKNGPLSAAMLSEAQEAERLTTKYRQESHERAYVKPREKLEEDIMAAEAIKAIRRDVKSFRPMEAPLSTRYCPDHPGVSIMRVGEYKYQCPLDKTIYNHIAGYKTMKGNTVPGGSIEGQTQGLGDRNLEQMSFSTRESALQGR